MRKTGEGGRGELNGVGKNTIKIKLKKEKDKARLKMGKELDRHFSKGGSQMVNKP